MKKPLPSYEPGDIVIVSQLVGFPQYKNCRAIVMSVLGTYVGTNSNGIRIFLKNTYRVMFLDNEIGIVSPDQLTPAEPPNRMDHDRRVEWSDMPEEIQRIWKESAT